jgi:hypothetical protein
MKLILWVFLISIGQVLSLAKTCNPDKIIEEINTFLNSSYVNDDIKKDFHYALQLISSSKDDICNDNDNSLVNKYLTLFNNTKNIIHDLTTISKFQMMHKFFDIDRRFFYNENVFLNKSRPYPEKFINMFPNPPILDENHQVTYYCKKSSWECIDFIQSAIRLIH